MNNSTFVFFELPLENANVLSHLGNHVNKEIKGDKEKMLTNEKKDILLNYPVVYIHTWQDDSNVWHFYVGESHDLTQRSNQHGVGAVNEDNGWKESWGDAIANNCTAVSFFFGSKDMNKSLCLDLEHSLCVMLDKQQSVTLETKATTRQINYSNKDVRDDLLEDIWGVLQPNYPLEQYGIAVEKAKTNLTNGSNLKPYPQNLPAECVYVDFQLNPNTLANDIAAALQKQDQNLPANDIAGALLEWPVIYMHMWQDEIIETGKNGKSKKRKQLRTYVGETDDLIKRTDQHLDPKQDIADDAWKGRKDSWREAVKDGRATMLVFGSPHFNKSMTLDIEHRLIHYTIFLESSVNGRTNEQKKYGNRDQMHPLFRNIVSWLSSRKPGVFLTLDRAKERSVFMASPLMELTDDQKNARTEILNTVKQALQTNQKSLIVVQGGAGTGKTVLASSLFFYFLENDISSRFIVNHKELFNLYSNMGNIWGLGSDGATDTKCIFEAAACINNPPQSLDVMIIDEAHLLYTQGHQGSIKKAQLPELQNQAKVCVLMLDFMQFTNQGQYLKFEDIKASKWIELTRQLRIPCCDETKNWILSLSEENEIPFLNDNKETYQEICRDSCKMPASKAYCFKDASGYEIKVFDTPYFMHEELNKRRTDGNKLCCMLATYDWPYDAKASAYDCTFHSIKQSVNGTSYSWYWYWHNTGKSSSMTNTLWYVDNTSSEVGSVHDIQGFDLEYAAVILGRSVSYSNGKIKFDPTEHAGEITKLRTVIDKNGVERKLDLSHRLISNELYILLTRATKGLYIYAEDEALRNALIEAIQGNNAPQK